MVCRGSHNVPARRGTLRDSAEAVDDKHAGRKAKRLAEMLRELQILRLII